MRAKDFPISILQVIPHKDFTVHIYFSDGRVKLYNAKPLLSKGVFKKLKDLDFFMNRCTVLNNTLAWDISGNFDERNCLDLDSDVLYQESVETKDPLEPESRNNII